MSELDKAVNLQMYDVDEARSELEALRAETKRLQEDNSNMQDNFDELVEIRAKQIAQAENAKLRKAIEPLDRCFLLLVAMKKEAKKLSGITDDKAKALAIMKINLMGYVMEIWSNRTAFDNDISILAALKDTP